MVNAGPLVHHRRILDSFGQLPYGVRRPMDIQLGRHLVAITKPNYEVHEGERVM